MVKSLGGLWLVASAGLSLDLDEVSPPLVTFVNA